VLFAAIVVFGGYYFEWKWTGFPKRTPWDWTDLLIGPVVLAIGGYWFTSSQNQATQVAAEQRAQDDALQSYLNQIGQLLLDKDTQLLHPDEGDDARTLARAWTLTVLPTLEGNRKRSVLQFLYEAGLIDKECPIVGLRGADLRGADLSGAILSDANLTGAFLSGTFLSGAFLSGAYLIHADLRGADLGGADLSGGDLRNADLSGAFLNQARLHATDLGGAILQEADLGGIHSHEAALSHANLRQAHCQNAFLDKANLHDADLRNADLNGAYLSGAYLSGANLSGVNLTGATIFGNYEELERQAASLEDATMTNGQKYGDWRQKYEEDWRKSKGRGENR
jgi:uncharacterized protein YjbI with pentapeptide repeats